MRGDELSERSDQSEETVATRKRKERSEEVAEMDPRQMHVCRLCDKLLSSSSSLDRHMLTHSGERPFVCKRCHMTFTTNGKCSIQNHRLITEAPRDDMICVNFDLSPGRESHDSSNRRVSSRSISPTTQTNNTRNRLMNFHLRRASALSSAPIWKPIFGPQHAKQSLTVSLLFIFSPENQNTCLSLLFDNFNRRFAKRFPNAN